MAISNFQSLLILIALILTIYIVDRKNFERQGIIFLRRTSKFLKWIEEKAVKYKTFFKYFGDFSIILSMGAIGSWYLFDEKKRSSLLKVVNTVSIAAIFFSIAKFGMPLYAALAFAIFGATGMIVYFLLSGTYGILVGAIKQASLQLVLPVDIPGAPVLFVPIHYWVIGIFTLVVMHEFAHALVARAHGIKVNSLGYGFLAIIPLAFAEPDEKQMKKSVSLIKSRVYCAGAAANIIAALLLLAVIHSAYAPSGLNYEGTIEGYPANGILPEKGVIIAIDGEPIGPIGDFAKFMSSKKSGEFVELTVDPKGCCNDAQQYKLQLAQNPEKAELPFIGINTPSRSIQHYEAKDSIKAVVGTNIASAITGSYMLLFWLYFLWLGIGLANLLPMKPIDGGLMMEELFKKFKFHPKLINHLSIGMISLIVFNLVGPKLIQVIT